MGQGYSQTLPPGPGVIEATAELSDLTFEKSLGGARFLRTIRARFENGVVVAKLCQKADPKVSFKKYATALQQERRRLRDIPNVLPYQRVRETTAFGLLVRQYVHTSLYDRISIRPFLENIEKKWIAFQLLCAVRDCHSRGVFHGDIKSENVLVTSWGWAYLTDFASAFKPVYLPEDNPADFSFFYDTSARRTCYVAPERFLAAGQKPTEGNIVQWNMDIFSLGCVLAELFTEAPTFTLTQLFRYRKGEYDPTITLLNKIDDDHLRSLITSMIRLDPQERWHAQDYLDEYKGKAFPLYFYQHFHTLMYEITDPSSGRKPLSPGNSNNGVSDDRIERIYNDFEILAVSLEYGPASSGQLIRRGDQALFPLQIDIPNDRHTASSNLSQTGDNGTYILVNVIASSMRSAARASSKLKACELLLAFAERLSDEAKLDRILPYVVPLLEDSDEMVLVTALRTMTQLLALVTVISPVNSFLFPQYIFPRLQMLSNSKGFKAHPIVRATYAQCLSSLADTAFRFLDLTSALKAEGSMLSTGRGTEDDLDAAAVSTESFDATRMEVIEQFEGQTKIFLTDPDIAVRRAFLMSVPSLCIFLGDQKASDVLLSHLNTYLNDPDWQLKCAFFQTMIGVAMYIGGARLEEFILPLMLQALTDPQEFVVEQALRSLAIMAEIGLLQRPKTWELTDTVARFLMHPNMWIKEAAAHFVSATTTYLSTADVRILAMPLVRPYLKVPVSSLSESELLDSLKKPLPRTVFDLALSWAQKVDRGLFWKSAKESKQLSYRGTAQMPPVSSVAELGPRTLGRTPKTDEDEQWLGRLRNAGLRSEDEMKLLAFREYLWRSAQLQKREAATAVDRSFYDQVISLTKLKLKLQTVIFDNDADTYQQRANGATERTIAEALEEATSPGKEMPFRPLQLHGLSDDQGAEASTGTSTPRPIDVQAARLATLRKPTTGSLSSSPSSAVGLLGREGDKALRAKSSAAALISGNDFRAKAQAEVATDDATAAGRLNTPIASERSVSRHGRKASEHAARPIHNYAGNDPTVLKLLDAVYVDNFSIDAAEFGPLIQPMKRGPIPSSSVSNSSGTWRPQGQLVAVLAEHTSAVTRILVSSDHVFFLTGSDDGSVKVWDSQRLERNVTHRSRQTHRLPGDARVTSLCFIDSTHTFVCTGADGSVQLVKVDVSDSSNVPRYGKLRVLRDWQIPSQGTSIEYAVWTEHYRAESSSMLIIATNLGRILAVDLRYMSIVFELHNPPQHGTPLCFCIGRRHDWLLIGTSQGVLDLWDLRFRLRLRSWTFHNPAPIVRLQLHPSKKTARRNRVCISGGTARGEFSVWDIEKVICHEVYRPAHAQAKERLHLRDYELHNLEEDRAEGILSRTDGLDFDVNEAAVKTSMHVGLHQPVDDSEALHAFFVTGGPDGRVRYWDCDRLDGCKIVSGAGPEEKPIYSYSHLALDTRVLTETFEEPVEPAPAKGGVASPAKGGVASPAPSASGKQKQAMNGPPKPTRYETIRSSAQQLLDRHLDTVNDVALLERPFGMVVSADRSGQVFVCQ